MTIYQLIFRLNLVPTVVAGIIGVVRYRWLPPNLRYLTGLLGFVIPLNLVGWALVLYQHNNLFLMPFYAVGEFGLLALVYRHTLPPSAFTRWLPGLVGGFAAYVWLDSWLAPDLTTQFRPSQQVVQALLLLLLVERHFRQLLHELRVPHLRQEPMFWVSAGLLIYNLGYLQIALFSNYLLHYSRALNNHIWSIHSLLFIVLYGCYCRALWLAPPK